MKVGTTEAWKIDKHVVVADTIEDAIANYKEYMQTETIDEIFSIDNIAICRKEEEE